MHKLITLLTLVFTLIIFSCDTTKSTTSTAGKSDSANENMSTNSGDLYTVKVTKDGIASPRKELSAKIAGADLTINYGSPSVKGRTLWGDLVPYDKVWRTGANEATTFKISRPVNIEGKTLAAGEYGFFTVPGESTWTIVFNATSNQWGSYEYDESKDVLRVKVKPQAAAEMSETMEFTVTSKNQVALVWGNLMIPFVVN